MAGWHQRCNEHELGQTPRDDEGQGGLAGCSPWGSQRVGHDWATEEQQLSLHKDIFVFRLYILNA